MDTVETAEKAEAADRPGTATGPPGAERAGAREWTGLAVLALPTLLVSIDVFVLLLALPKLSADLGAGSTQQLWIMDVYAFLLAGFLITMGTLGDRIGRRRLLLTGAVAFGAASVLAAYSTSPGMLIAARAVLGIAGAILAPSTMALLTNLFRAPRQRAVARRIRPAYVIAAGLTVSATGLVLLTQADADSGSAPFSGLTAVVVGFALMNTGGGPAVVLGTDLVVGPAPPEKAGSAASMNETSGQFGFALGLATLGSPATAVYRHRIEGSVPGSVPPAAADAARDTLAGAVGAAQRLPDQLGAALLGPARDAFVGGMHMAAGASSVLLAVVAVAVVVLLRQVPPSGEIAEGTGCREGGACSDSPVRSVR